MKLIDLLKGVKYLDIKGSLGVEIEELCQNIYKIKKSSLFFCYKGINFDGHDIAYQAKSKGAVVLVVEKFLDIDLPQVLVKKTRKVMPKICNNFFKNILSSLKLVGVTGTNGKTTTSHMIYDLLNMSGVKTGLIGTSGAKYSNNIINTGLTTPDTVDLFYLFNKMKQKEITHVVMEVSAHALYLDKLYGLKFEVGIFSNLSQDHLDFFKTVKKYALTKLKFLKRNFCKICLINIDDNFGKMFYKLSNSKKLSYSLENPADFFAIDVKLGLNYSQFIANLNDEVINVFSNFSCKFNVYNLLSALSCCNILGVKVNSLQNNVSKIKNVDGRMNLFLLKNGANAVIDYAHTPDGLEKVLISLRQLLIGSKIITVFGCGGNRDASKRSKMGEIATRLSDKVFITSDNPRNENPYKIINDILKIVKKNNYEIEENREKAIKKAIEFSSVGDIILIAGKGAENYQERQGVKYPFSDKRIIANFVEN